MRDAGIEDITIVVSPGTAGPRSASAPATARAGASGSATSRRRRRSGWPTPSSPPRTPRRLAVRRCTSATTCCADGISGAGARSSSSSAPDALILLQHVPDPRAVRRRRARRRRSSSRLDREAGRAEVRPRARRRLHVHGPGIWESAEALAPVRARRATRSPTRSRHLDRPRHARRAARRHRLVEGHRPVGGHARGEPPPARPDRAAQSTASWPTRDLEGARRVERGRRARALPRAQGPVAIGARARYRGTPTSARTRLDLRGRRHRGRRDRALASILERSRMLRPRQPARGLADRSQRRHRRPELKPSAYRILVGDDSHIGIL